MHSVIVIVCVTSSGKWLFILLLQVNSGVKMTGTAWWMAPELVPGGKQSNAASEKSDVW